MTSDIGQRKADHLDLCVTADVGFREKTTLFEDVELIHDSLPELALEAIDTSVSLFGKRLRAPLVIASMTGGTERAREVNRSLARIAEERGYGFGLGSQRAMLDSEKAPTYAVRDVAPTTLLLGNLGGVQARSMPTDAIHELVKGVGADALCIHLNPAQEIVQEGGDRYFAGVLDTLKRLAEELPVPVIAKETGCGIGPATARRIARAGVRHVDVSGAGGTSWVAVEAERATGAARTLGDALRDWGVPTAASVAIARATRPRFATIIATGGVSTGLEVAKAIALGAHAAGIARPLLKALTNEGEDGARRLLDAVETELRAVMFLVGARTVSALRKAPTVQGGHIAKWVALVR